jgi:hypothetical protein
MRRTCGCRPTEDTKAEPASAAAYGPATQTHAQSGPGGVYRFLVRATIKNMSPDEVIQTVTGIITAMTSPTMINGWLANNGPELDRWASGVDPAKSELLRKIIGARMDSLRQAA